MSVRSRINEFLHPTPASAAEVDSALRLLDEYVGEQGNITHEDSGRFGDTKYHNSTRRMDLCGLDVIVDVHYNRSMIEGSLGIRRTSVYRRGKQLATVSYGLDRLADACPRTVSGSLPKKYAADVIKSFSWNDEE